MSRSYKKNPIGKCAPVDAKWQKRSANRKYRRCLSAKDMIAGKSSLHRRFTDPWDIHDVVYRWSKKDAEANWECEERQIKNGTDPAELRWHRTFRTKERFMNYWKISMIRK